MHSLKMWYNGDRHAPVRLTKLEAVSLADFLEYVCEGEVTPERIRALWPHAGHTHGPAAVVRAHSAVRDADALASVRKAKWNYADTDN